MAMVKKEKEKFDAEKAKAEAEAIYGPQDGVPSSKTVENDNEKDETVENEAVDSEIVESESGIEKPIYGPPTKEEFLKKMKEEEKLGTEAEDLDAEEEKEEEVISQDEIDLKVINTDKKNTKNEETDEAVKESVDAESKDEEEREKFLEFQKNVQNEIDRKAAIEADKKVKEALKQQQILRDENPIINATLQSINTISKEAAKATTTLGKIMLEKTKRTAEDTKKLVKDTYPKIKQQTMSMPDAVEELNEMTSAIHDANQITKKEGDDTKTFLQNNFPAISHKLDLMKDGQLKLGIRKFSPDKIFDKMQENNKSLEEIKAFGEKMLNLNDKIPESSIFSHLKETLKNIGDYLIQRVETAMNLNNNNEKNQKMDR